MTIVLAAIVVIVPAIVWGYPWMTARALMQQALHDADASERSKALVELGRERERRAVDAILEALATDDDAGVREAAAYALHRIKAPQGTVAIGEAIDREPDTIVRAKMVEYVGRLRGRAALEELKAWSDEPTVWRSTGAALARIELADPSAAALLFDRLNAGNAFLTAHITEVLKPTVETMMEMIGSRVDLTVDRGQPWSADQVAQLQAWWQRYEHATGKLLADMAIQRVERRGIRRELARLGGARRRAESILGLK